ncbi:9320_t:CDS:1, partial [Gigaspora rosea]
VTKVQPDNDDDSEGSETGDETKSEYEEEELEERFYRFSEDEGNIFDYLFTDDFKVDTIDDDQEEEVYEKIFLGKLGQPQVLDIGMLESNVLENVGQLLVNYSDLFAWIFQDLG